MSIVLVIIIKNYALKTNYFTLVSISKYYNYQNFVIEACKFSCYSLFNIVKVNNLWIVANYKETQLEKIRVGQDAVIKVDAYPHHEFKAKVTSLSPATGAKFALLPPDNASGNFVKTVQRLPIKIEFVDKNDEMLKLIRPGMNVEADILIKSNSTEK